MFFFSFFCTKSTETETANLHQPCSTHKDCIGNVHALTLCYCWATPSILNPPPAHPHPRLHKSLSSRLDHFRGNVLHHNSGRALGYWVPGGVFVLAGGVRQNTGVIFFFFSFASRAHGGAAAAGRRPTQLIDHPESQPGGQTSWVGREDTT